MDLFFLSVYWKRIVDPAFTNKDYDDYRTTKIYKNYKGAFIGHQGNGAEVNLLFLDVADVGDA